MPLVRFILCVAAPPLAVIDRGCAVFLLVILLTIMGWIPGVFAAMVVTLLYPAGPRHVMIPHAGDTVETSVVASHRWIQLADGTLAEVVEDDEVPQRRRAKNNRIDI